MTAAYKALRNKAYRGSDRLLIADYNGVDYLTNAYFAEENTDIPARLELTSYDKPDLARVTDLKAPEVQLHALEPDGEYITLRSSDGKTKCKVQLRYYEYFTRRYPSHKLTTEEKYSYAPVRVYDLCRDSGKPVAFIMPVKE